VGGQADADVDSELPIPKTRILCGHNIGGQFFGRAVWRDNVENDIEHYLAAVVRSARARVNRHDLEELAEEYRRERLYVGDYKGRPGFIAKMIVYLLNSKRRNDDYIEAMYLDPHRRKKARGFLLHKYSHVMTVYSVSEHKHNKDLGFQEGPAGSSDLEKIIGKRALLQDDSVAVQTSKKLRRQRKQLKKLESMVGKIADAANSLLSANNLPTVDLAEECAMLSESSDDEEDFHKSAAIALAKVNMISSAAALEKGPGKTEKVSDPDGLNGNGLSLAGKGTLAVTNGNGLSAQEKFEDPDGATMNPLLRGSPGQPAKNNSSTFEIEKPTLTPTDSVGGLFDAVDTNGNGNISMAELNRFWMQRCHKGMVNSVEIEQTLHQIQELFVQLDEDKTGTLDREEFQALMETMADGDWEESMDPTTGRIYYVNLSTDHAQWTAPGSSEADTWLTRKLPPLKTSQMGGTSATTWDSLASTH
jgi:hypothetical protein